MDSMGRLATRLLIGAGLGLSVLVAAGATGVALFADGPALGQLWLFWVAPIVGALIAGWVYTNLLSDEA